MRFPVKVPDNVGTCHLNTPAALFINDEFVKILFRFGGFRFA